MKLKQKRTDIHVYKYDQQLADSYGILVDTKKANLNIAMTADNKKRDGSCFAVIYDADKREKIWSSKLQAHYGGKSVDSSAFVKVEDDISDVSNLPSDFK